MRDGSYFADVNEGQGGVGGRLYPDEFGLAGADEVGEFEGDAGGEGDMNAMRRGDFGKVPMRSLRIRSAQRLRRYYRATRGS